MNKEYFPKTGETVYTHVTENGLTVVVIPRPGFRATYAVFGTRYGGVNVDFTDGDREIHTPAGIAHYLEHKMFDMPDGTNALERLAAGGADPNAFTSFEQTCYHFVTTDDYEPNLRLLLNFVQTPYFTEETVNKERGIITQEIKMGEDEPEDCQYYNLMELIHPGHPVCLHIAGTVESIGEITAETLNTCHKTFYNPSNMVLCVVGNVNPEDVVKIAEEEVTAPKINVPKPVLGDDNTKISDIKEKVAEMDVSRTQFLYGVPFASPDYGVKYRRAKLVSRIAVELFIGESSRLYNDLYDSGTVNSDFYVTTEFVAGVSHLLIGGEGENYQEIISKILEAREKTAETGFDDESFNRIIRHFYGKILRSFETFELVALSVVDGVFCGYNHHDILDLILDIKKEECEEFIKTAFDPDKLRLSLVVPR